MNAKTQTIDKRRDLYHFYHQRIDGADVATVKRYFRSPSPGWDPRGGIREIILVAKDEDLAQIAARLDCESDEVRRDLGLSLAQAGKIRFAVEVVAAVPAPWTPFAIALDELDDRTCCEVIYAPPAYFVKIVRSSV